MQQRVIIDCELAVVTVRGLRLACKQARIGNYYPRRNDVHLLPPI